MALKEYFDDTIATFLSSLVSQIVACRDDVFLVGIYEICRSVTILDRHPGYTCFSFSDESGDIDRFSDTVLVHYFDLVGERGEFLYLFWYVMKNTTLLPDDVRFRFCEVVKNLDMNSSIGLLGQQIQDAIRI